MPRKPSEGFLHGPGIGQLNMQAPDLHEGIAPGSATCSSSFSWMVTSTVVVVCAWAKSAHRLGPITFWYTIQPVCVLTEQNWFSQACCPSAYSTRIKRLRPGSGSFCASLSTYSVWASWVGDWDGCALASAWLSPNTFGTPQTTPALSPMITRIAITHFFEIMISFTPIPPSEPEIKNRHRCTRFPANATCGG